MVPEEQVHSLEEIGKVMRMLQKRMCNNALYHFNHIDARTLRKLQSLDLFKGDASPLGADVDVQALEDPNHSRREKLSPGPFVQYIAEGAKPRQVLIELPLLLLSDFQEVRKASLTCIEQMMQTGSYHITPKTENVLKEGRVALSSNDANEWRRAAVTISDALVDDALFALQGVRQCLECQSDMESSLNVYVPRVLRPTISSLDSIKLHISNPESQHERILSLIIEVVEKARSLTEVCASYYEKLGYLPLAPRYAMAEAVQRWLLEHPETNVWSDVWAWARGAFGPVPIYHACCVFALYPELVPQKKLPVLWDEMLRVINAGRPGSDDPVKDSWVLRRDLVRHYSFHLEAHLPDNDSANIGSFAWWFAEQVARIFPDGPEAARFYRENWVQPALDLSGHVWAAATPHVGRSFLRYMTHGVLSPWAVGLLSIMGDKLEQFAPAEQSEQVPAQFTESLGFHAFSGMPFPLETPSDPTFAIECSLGNTVLKWAHFQPEEKQKALDQLVTASRELGNTDGLCKALLEIAESSSTDQVVIATCLKAKAYTDPSIAEKVWEILCNADWRRKVLGNVQSLAFGLLLEAFGILMLDNNGKWYSLLPHYLADVCEITSDEERRRQLFLYILHLSLASDTVSAVRRLLSGDQKANFIQLVKQFRERVEDIRSEYPPWVAGKLRALIANLRVA